MIQNQPRWASNVTKLWKISGVPHLKKHGSLLKQGIRLLEKHCPKFPEDRLALSEQPYDQQLLSCSFLYRRSRKLYLKQGGAFVATLVSSPRTLSSSVLLEQVIEYSPIQRELIWSAVDPIESKKPDRLLSMRSYSSSLFHEQSHRLLWKLMPSAPSTQDGLRRFLNLAESLVITMDMALGDELGEKLASLFYLIGVVYDPGTPMRKELPNPREYRNYLQAALHATYLNLEFYKPQEIPKAIQALFPNLGPFARRAAIRSGNLDPAFVERTNVLWQKRHKKVLREKLCATGVGVLDLPDDPMDNRQQYLIAEKWFDLMGL